MDERRRRGNRGEDAVTAALIRRGYELLERQYRCRWGELDLIVRSPEGVLCFVEVKTRSGTAIAEAREAVTPAKQGRLRRAAAWYLARTGLDCPCRFDVAEVYPDPMWQRPQIHYISNAFQ